MLISQFIRFSIVGVIATFVHAGGVVLLVELFFIDPILSSIPAYISALITAYILNHKWSFESDKPHSEAFVPYAIVSTIGFMLNIAMMYVLINWQGVDYRLALALVVVTIPVITFTMHKFWTFKYYGKQAGGKS